MDKQLLTAAPTGGTFTLSVGDAKTRALPHDATQEQVNAAVQAAIREAGEEHLRGLARCALNGVKAAPEK